jgi:hypothetical protein
LTVFCRRARKGAIGRIGKAADVSATVTGTGVPHVSWLVTLTDEAGGDSTGAGVVLDEAACEATKPRWLDAKKRI